MMRRFWRRTFESIDGAIINPIDFDGSADVHFAKAIGANAPSHISGFGDFSRKLTMSVSRVNLVKKIKGRKPILQFRNLFYLRNRPID